MCLLTFSLDKVVLLGSLDGGKPFRGIKGKRLQTETKHKSKLGCVTFATSHHLTCKTAQQASLKCGQNEVTTGSKLPLTLPPKLTVTLTFLVVTCGKSATPLRASSLRTNAVPNVVPFLEKEMVLSSPSKSYRGEGCE